MAACLMPFHKKDTGESFPCGRCFECLSRRASGWSFRLMQKEKHCMSAYFLTLTYDTQHVPITKNGYMSLNRASFLNGKYVSSHMQLFFKNLRYRQFGNKNGNIAYYMCGEYGEHSFRPHYHAILFNADLKYVIGERDAKFVSVHTLELDGKMPYNTDLWPYGHITIGTVSAASVGYTLKYMQKPFRIPLHQNDDRLPEYSAMSKGLGSTYLTPQMIAWHKASLLERMYINVGDGKKAAMPRYYKLKMYTDDERRLISHHYEQNPVKDVQLSVGDKKRLSEIKLKSLQKNKKL